MIIRESGLGAMSNVEGFLAELKADGYSPRQIDAARSMAGGNYDAQRIIQTIGEPQGDTDTYYEDTAASSGGGIFDAIGSFFGSKGGQAVVGAAAQTGSAFAQQYIQKQNPSWLPSSMQPQYQGMGMSSGSKTVLYVGLGVAVLLAIYMLKRR